MPTQKDPKDSPPTAEEQAKQREEQEALARQQETASASFAERRQEAASRNVQEYNAEVEAGRRSVTPTQDGRPKMTFLGSAPDAPDPDPVPTGTLAAADIPLPRNPQWATAGTYIFTPKDIFASTAIPAAVMSYVLDRSYISADAQGKRIGIEGTLLALYPAKGPGYMKVKQAGETVAGVLHGRYDLTDVDADVAVIIGNAWLRRDKLIDEGTYGTVLAQSATDLAVRNVVLTTFDV